MNPDSEQLTLDMNLLVAQDQPLKGNRLPGAIIEALGGDHCRIINVPPRRHVVEYQTQSGKIYHLLACSCTYLGNPHPIYKKRVQLKPWFNEYATNLQKSNPGIEVRYIGVYHYEDKHHGNNIVFIDFKKDSYLAKRGHNSSAHVYTNDLFQGMTYGIFSKEDAYGNLITTIRKDCFENYLNDDGKDNTNNLFDLFEKFNRDFSFGNWLKALDVIKEMHANKWHQWRQAEWAGWYLEYKFNDFTIANDVTRQMRYVGSAMKHEGDLDFDIRFEDEDFYGDLKASDVLKKETPGNDQDNLVRCIFQYNRFWYVIYEHETIKDSEGTEYSATIGRNRYIRSIDPSYSKDDMSYASRMKNAVKFVKMAIIELNRVNYRDALSAFNQGHQPDGKARKPKFLINKKVLDNDNYVVFRYKYEGK